MLAIKRYRFRCQRAKDKIIVGTISARTVGLARAELNRRYPGLCVLVPESQAHGLFKRPNQTKLALFFRGWEAMFQAGIPLLQGLEFMGKSEEDPNLRPALDFLAQTVSTGNPLSEAMASPEMQRIFSPVMSALVAAGEQTGRLARSINRLAVLSERQHVLRRKVYSALAYPGFVVCAMSALGLLCVILLGSQDSSAMSLFGGQPPLLTRWVVALATWIQNPWSWLTVLSYLAALFGLGRFCWRDATVKRSIHQLALRLPLIGPLWRKMITSQMLQIIAAANGVGLGVPSCLNLARPLCTNLTMLESYDEAITAFLEGVSLDRAFEESGVFSALTVAMVHIGLENGKLELMLAHLSEMMEDEAETLLLDLTRFIEPALLLIAGVITTILALGMLQPIFELAQRL